MQQSIDENSDALNYFWVNICDMQVKKHVFRTISIEKYLKSEVKSWQKRVKS